MIYMYKLAVNSYLLKMYLVSEVKCRFQEMSCFRWFDSACYTWPITSALLYSPKLANMEKGERLDSNESKNNGGVRNGLHLNSSYQRRYSNRDKVNTDGMRKAHVHQLRWKLIFRQVISLVLAKVKTRVSVWVSPRSLTGKPSDSPVSVLSLTARVRLSASRVTEKPLGN